ncbi:MAG: metalloregulator ArsR/SmtB family transcription factor [Candidatus Methanomethylophilaceae archaeon]
MVKCPANEIFKALSDPNRLKIVEILADGETCACKLLEELSVSQPTLSHHMGILQRAGIVVGRKNGQWVHYSIEKKTVTELIEYLISLSEKIPEQDVRVDIADDKSSE